MIYDMNKEVDVAKKVPEGKFNKIMDVDNEIRKMPKYKFNKRLSLFAGSGITLKNNETKDIAKVSRSLENRNMLLRGITRKINSQERGIHNFLALLTRVALPLTKNILTPLAESVLVLLRLTAAALAEDAAIQRKLLGRGQHP